MQVDKDLNREDRYRQNMLERRPGAFFNDENDEDDDSDSTENKRVESSAGESLNNFFQVRDKNIEIMKKFGVIKNGSNFGVLFSFSLSEQ